MSMELHLARGGTETVPNATRPEQWRLCDECDHRAGFHDNGTMRCTAHHWGHPCQCDGYPHEFTENGNDCSMCICGIPAYYHEDWERRGGTPKARVYTDEDHQHGVDHD